MKVEKQYVLKKRSLLQNLKSNWQLYLFLIPVLTYFIIFHYIPMYGVQIAFKKFNIVDGIIGSEWLGFDHFRRFFNSHYFFRLLKNTVILSAYQLLLFPLPIIFALSLNELKDGWFKRWSQTLTYAPHFISVVVLAGMIIAFLDPITGLINNVIVSAGGKPVPFLISPKWFRHIFVWSGVWQSLGWGTIIYLAALSGVNPELLEAAAIDGATRLQRILHINIPTITPTIVVLFILEVGNFMSVGFEKVLLLQNNLNSETSDVIQTYVYEIGLLNAQYDFAAAVGLFDSLINITLIVLANWVARKVSDSSLW